MLYPVQIEVVLVIVMGAFVGIEIVFKFCLQPCIGGLTAAQEHPELSKNFFARYWQKQRNRKQYQKRAKAAAFVGIEVVFKFCLQPCIGGLGPQHIPILGRVAGKPPPPRKSWRSGPWLS